jgi:CheY-like chemotaxis protein
MSPEVKQRAFEPFFTTKGVKSTGLGLAVAYGTIRRHGGEISVDSTEGIGTTVAFWLPRAAPTAAPPAAPAEPKADRKGRILVIDDESSVLDIVAEVLTAHGHAVTVAHGGREGLLSFSAGPYDLVMTDLGMPDLHGWEGPVHQGVRATPVLVLTGWGTPRRRPPASSRTASHQAPDPSGWRRRRPRSVGCDPISTLSRQPSDVPPHAERHQKPFFQ